MWEGSGGGKAPWGRLQPQKGAPHLGQDFQPLEWGPPCSPASDY